MSKKLQGWDSRTSAGREFFEFYEDGYTAKVVHDIGQAKSNWSVEGGSFYKSGTESSVAKAKSRAWANLRLAQRS